MSTAMIRVPRASVLRYLGAVAAVIAAVLVKEALGPRFVPSVYLTFFGAVLWSARYLGFGPGLLCTMLSALIGAYLYMPPILAPGGFNVMTAGRIGLFVFTSGFITWLLDRHRSAQERVAENESRLRRMVESDMIGIIFWDREGKILDANDRFLSMTGYSRVDLRDGSFRWDDLSPPEQTEIDAEALRQIDFAGSYVPFEKEFVRKDGSRIPVLIGGAATNDEKDKGVSCVLDMTERKRGEDDLRRAKEDLEARVAERTEALRASEERYRRVSELSSDYAYSLRVEESGKIVVDWHTGAFARITGFHLRELSTTRLFELFHPDERAAFADQFARLLQGESVRREYRLRTKSGEYRWVQDYTRPQWNAEHTRIETIFGAMQDITERKRAEEDLRLSEERFALAAAGANDGLWDWNLESNTMFLSPRWKEILGLATDEIGNDAAEWVRRIHPADLDRVTEETRAVFDGKVSHLNSEYRMRHTDGTYRWVLSRGRAIRDASGKAYRAAGSLTDLTARKKAEAEIRRRENALARAQRLGALGEMSAGLAHELNQPLAAIVNYARGCANHLRSRDAPSPEMLHAIDQISKQALRAGEIVQRYRGLVRSSALSRDWVDLNALTQETTQLAKAAADAEQVDIRLDLAPELPAVLADRLQIEQVLMNLIRNGLDAMREIGRGELHVRTFARDDEVEVAVEDEGIGIPDEIRDHIFDPFVTTKTAGLGMGLSISRSIIDAHGGRLWPTTSARCGTTFRFTLPILTANVVALPRRA